MKYLIIILISSISVSGIGQVVNTKFDNFKNEEIKIIVENNSLRLIKALKNTGFSDNDTINLYFNYPKEYVCITHNLDDKQAIDVLYRNAVIHYSTLISTVNHYKIDNLRLFVKVSPNNYLMWEAYSDIKGEKVKIKDRLFVKDYLN